jgi:hypothetical protein
MRENRLYGSEGGEGDSLSRPLSIQMHPDLTIAHGTMAMPASVKTRVK